MKTPLALRSFKTRMCVAYLAQAAHTYEDCKPGNTFSRAYSSCTDSVHPYIKMWHNIGTFYNRANLGHLSDEEINARFDGAFRVGFNHCFRDITAEQVRTAYQTWETRGWNRYEIRRKRRHGWTGKILLTSVLLGSGIEIPFGVE